MLDQHCENILVHTGQNFDENLSDVFFREMDIRQPDVHLGVRASSFGEQAGQIIAKIDQEMEAHKPDRILILGDTNSALSALPAARRGIPVFHMEAGNRCYDDRVPEEINRRIIDHSSKILMPYTQRSKDNLVREGIDRDRIFVTGNPIKEVLDTFASQIDESGIMESINVKSYDYFLVTLHHSENVDGEGRLRGIFEGLRLVSEKFGKDVLVSVHPRTAEKLTKFGIAQISPRIRLFKPMGFFDFIKLEKNALAVLTDSGTVQEECAIFKVPNVTIRDVTERPETIECGSNILCGGDPNAILAAAGIAIAHTSSWEAPAEYEVSNVANITTKIVLGHLSLRKHH
jgi:UDP-N-acetylglucosamine 2-epimerase (non-hydrolysing)